MSTPDPNSYLILVESGPNNYSAWSPDLPGCAGAGDTIEETVADMREAIAFHIEGLAADGDPIPEPTGPGVYIEQNSAAA
jgi:predicted RNase H-like HicB family nuclease